ncbi:hypothetical protein MRX96_040420 [Rhipicephalus microplus]
MNENIKSLVNNLPWMDESSKQMAYSKLDRMNRVVMPHNSFFVPKGTRGTVQRVSGHEGQDLYDEPVGCFKSLPAPPQPRTLSGRVQRSHVSTFRPGVLFVLAQLNDIGDRRPEPTALLLQRHVGHQASRIDVDGVRGAWLKPAAAAVHAEKSDCDVRTTTDRSKWRPLRVFPAVAGLEVAYASFSAAVTRDYLAVEDFRILHLEQFTDKQIFFLAFCYSQCSKRPQTRGDECNVPAKNSHLFAEAFHCSSKSPMNPPEKCQFF